MRKVLVWFLLISVFLFPMSSYANLDILPITCHKIIFLGKVGTTIGKGGFLFSESLIAVFFSPIILAATWHIPAWTTAKHNHTEVQYQAQEMFPQKLFDKLSSKPHTITMISGGNSGNFVGGNSGLVE